MELYLLFVCEYLQLFLLEKEIFQHYLQDKQMCIFRILCRNIHQVFVSRKDASISDAPNYLHFHLQDLTGFNVFLSGSRFAKYVFGIDVSTCRCFEYGRKFINPKITRICIHQKNSKVHADVEGFLKNIPASASEIGRIHNLSVKPLRQLQPYSVQTLIQQQKLSKIV